MPCRSPALIHHVLARHEQGGGFMAQGIARATGAPAVCLLLQAPGRPIC
ncbi:thiamine pyrophosphate-binding protein [Candidatus Accumulibacter sp. ACC007]|nr:thiamine pyrophosphate-binding protein [Candidatus Accumulibacter sp. ACC007]